LGRAARLHKYPPKGSPHGDRIPLDTGMGRDLIRRKPSIFHYELHLPQALTASQNWFPPAGTNPPRLDFSEPESAKPDQTSLNYMETP